MGRCLLSWYRCALVILMLLPFGCSTVRNENRIDNFPMYGQPDVPRPDFLKDADQEFIDSAIQKFGGSREIASDAWANVGEEFLKKGKLHYAMRRYNQSWLLDPQNYLPYWGFGRILLERDEFDGAIKHFETALRLVDDDHEKVALLSDAAVAYSYAGWNAALNAPRGGDNYYAKANGYFEQSTTLDSSYPNSWRRWTFSLVREKNYARAYEIGVKAQSLDPHAFREGFLEEIEHRKNGLE